MLKSIIRTLLQKFIDDIDADNCNITMEQQSKIISVLSNIANPDQRMSKIQACDYIGVSRATFDKVLQQNNIRLENNVGYDYVFVGNMCKADYYGSSITDEKHFALYIKDTIDDEDAGDGTTMRRWYATMVANGMMVDWEDVI